MVRFKRDEDESLKHYGVKRRSGRYPWGSGGNDLSEAKDFQSALAAMRARTGDKKMSDAEIAKVFGMTTTELRANIAISGLIAKQADINRAQSLKDAGHSNIEIGKQMGINESSVRGLLAPGAARKQAQLEEVANALKQRVDEGSGYVDVGKGVEHHLGISKTKLDVALSMLETEGYVVETIQQPNATTAHDTRVRVLAKPGESWSTINQNKTLIEPLKAWKGDDDTPAIWQEPLRLNPARLDIKYGPQGGDKADGVIYVRPGVKDLSLNGASYAQVRIQVGANHFIKGMAVMKEGLPAGVDVQFNTNKKDTGNKLDALKPVKKNADGTDVTPAERFGAVFRQLTDPKTGKVKSALNIVNDEDNWDDWSKSLATQMLSKQKPDFVKRQLDVTYAQKKAQLDEIMALTNPVVKKELLKSYADDMDASSVHLKAAALPRQKTHVILPVNSLKDNEVYAPGYKDGEKVVLIRYPHGGKFEIPELVVNNRNKAAREIMPPGKTRAAIGINAKVAERLSGADFDGDTVVVIPNNSRRVQTESPLKKLQGFNPQDEYRGSSGKDAKGNLIMLPGVKKMGNTQTEMGRISNLITDMTIGGATHDKLARAVRHSMVVIDAEKHGLDYQRSERENGIAALRKEYQPGRYGGASTIISRTSRKVAVEEVKVRPKRDGGGIDPKTGEPIYVPSGRTTSKRIEEPDGTVRWEKTPKIARVPMGSRIPGVTVQDPITGERRPVKDAYDLVSGPANMPRNIRGTVVERHYAEYSNKVRSLANQARLAEDSTPDPRVSPSAKQAYSSEVASLRAKVKLSQANSPLERQAQTAAAVIVKMKREANPAMSREELKRTKARAIRETRDRVGAKPQRINITAKEWEAIQNNAVAADTLREVLTKADMDQVRQLAQPKAKLLMQPHNVTLARSLMNSGYTRAEIADQLGVSVSTLDRSLNS